MKTLYDVGLAFSCDTLTLLFKCTRKLPERGENCGMEVYFTTYGNM